jgi:hypothetical protein
MKNDGQVTELSVSTLAEIIMALFQTLGFYTLHLKKLPVKIFIFETTL